MKKQMLFAAVAGLTLVSAHPGPERTIAPAEARSGYPPCSRTVTDRCIQLYERGVRTASNLARNAAPSNSPAVVAVGSVPHSDRVPVRVIRPADDDIDVAYAGEVLQAPRAGHHPVDVVRHRHGGDGPTRVIVERHGPDAPTRVIVRERRHAHAAPVVLAEARPRAHPPHHAPRAHAVAHVAPRAAAPRRPVPMRVRRAGERG